MFIYFKSSIFLLFVLVLHISCRNQSPPLSPPKNITFLDGKSAASFLSTGGYFYAVRPIDQFLQMGGSEDLDYIDFIKKEAISFLPEDMDKINKTMSKVEHLILEIHPNYLSDSIKFIKVEGKRYGDQAYFTKDNAIIIPAEELSSFNEKKFLEVMLHELFHIFSRQNSMLKKELYKSIGFEALPGKLHIDSSFNQQILLNPDGINFHYEIKIKSYEQVYRCLPVLYTESTFQDYKENYFENLQFDLFPVYEKNGQFVLANPEEAQQLNLKSHPNFYAQIGRNTDYIIHPDEILADNFVFMVQKKKGKDRRGREILSKMKTLWAKYHPKKEIN